jgi:hypothetical protein
MRYGTGLQGDNLISQPIVLTVSEKPKKPVIPIMQVKGTIPQQLSHPRISCHAKFPAFLCLGPRKGKAPPHLNQSITAGTSRRPGCSTPGATSSVGYGLRCKLIQQSSVQELHARIRN